ncbi:MAG: phosphatidylethanolamine N-methyltransferase family protein [Saprospirales bacterium]|nr:phosphatidylethanolamine N-methyltransferase family protein [Saprospirales bacterium]
MKNYSMFLRALFAFLALPGVVAGLVPALILHFSPPATAGTELGWPVMALGILILPGCVRAFYFTGKGTLAPWSPPRHLVTGGWYRFSRNPMYIAVLLTVGGLALAKGSAWLAGYALVLAMVFHLRVLCYEEPILSRLFGTEWAQYRKRTRRWL